MAREQPNVGDLLPLLESSDIHQLEEIKGLINEHLSTERGAMLLNGLVDYFLESNSAQAIHILSSVREPHDKHLLDKMNECMTKQACRLPTLTLLGHVVRKQPSWIHKISRYPLLLSLLKCLKTDLDVVVLITGVLVLITLLPMIPHAGKQHLYEFFDIFGRLASWNLKNPGHISEVYLIHLHASIYSLFHRLYGMYPCNFVSYLRSHYNMKENVDTFEEVVKPMLEHVRIHPELVTGTKDHELDPTRWKKFEIHDIVIECAKVSLDPKEASCEEGYATMPGNFYPHPELRPQDSVSSPYTDFHNSYGSSSSTPFSTPRQPLPPPLSLAPLPGAQSLYRSPQTSRSQNSSCEPDSTCGVKELWSPSSQCGMATPPSSRGMSPNQELSHSASHLPGPRVHSTSGGKGTPASSTPATSSPPHTPSDFPIPAPLLSNTTSPPQKDGHPVEAAKPSLVRLEPIGDPEKGGEVINRDGGGETVSKTLSVFMKEQELQQRTEKEREETAISEELLKITEDMWDLAGLRVFDSPFYRTTETLTGTQEKPLPNPPLGGPVPPQDPHNAVSTSDNALENAQGAIGGGGDSSRGLALDQSWSIEPVCPFSPIQHPLHQSLSALEDEVAKFSGLFSPSRPMKNPSLPYEALFDLALPRAASLFVGRRTSEARGRAALERMCQQQEGLEDREEEEEGEGMVNASPLEVLDHLVQQGSDTHDKVLKRLPLPSKSADWTHFGGSAPLDELHTLRSQLLLLHSQLLYERYKREQHAVRNRRLLRRVINATALEEQNNAMKDQLNLQSVDVVTLKESLQVEQQRCRQLWDDRETVVTRLHSQVRQLQQGRDDYYTKNQELQSLLNEYQKKMNELEADLQRANNKVCHTGHLLNQMTIKLSTSESTQQQMSFLNKQLLLLGEAHKLDVLQQQHTGSDNTKEAQMVQASWGKEVERLRQSLLQQGQKLEAAQQRVGELETQLTKKEHLIVEQKKFLEDVKGQAKGELQASESRYQAQRRATQLLQTELLHLYSRLEMEGHACLATPSAAGGSSTDPGPPIDSCIMEPDGPVTLGTNKWSDDSRPYQSPRGNGSTLLPGQPKANNPPKAPPVNSASSTQDIPPPLLVEPSFSHPHAPLATTPLPPDAVPLTVGSYPSANSFLGMRARELFRNKSESQCDEEPPHLAGLSQGLKTELCVEPLFPPLGNALTCPVSAPVPTPTLVPASIVGAPLTVPAKEHPPETRQRAIKQESPTREMGGARGGAVAVASEAQPRQQQQFRIMDYNETQQEHS
ncbi:hamartin isoform X1 [Oncorhynchus kisutch]|uniref:TSC complex subunit 1b n=1 Tax=Oncorhynchus kisutch TaxID=8019 RepID=A0A8C7JG61_ONCKI|nr:hamartin isoform X1 [Oncorhynchus kisutch]XP_020320941.1 hamartin isoform X1 [Oncorhynchus kisutch]XP_031664632.1 hamartin isoform X1 [Oncorhynchus kisutch]